MVAVTILAIWGGFGNYMLYFITGMTGISEDVYESAKIDGATGVQTFFRHYTSNAGTSIKGCFNACNHWSI